MGENEIISEFEQLYKSAARSKTARLRDLYDQIEALRKRGFTHATIVNAMKKHGLEFDVKTFEATFYRIKKERQKLPVQPTRMPLGVTPQLSNSTTEIRKIENPADIRKARRREIDLDDYSNKEGE